MSTGATDPKKPNTDALLDDHTVLRKDPRGLVFIDISNYFATGSICLQGAHVIHYQPTDKAPVLWVSDAVDFQPGKAIRGGIPICWPWFGAHPNHPDYPAHGLARTATWQLRNVTTNEQGTQLQLVLPPDAVDRQYWPFAVSAELVVNFGKTLEMQLTTHNNASEPVTITQALHSYFAVDDIHSVQVQGLDGCRYIDTVPAERPVRQQQGPVTFSGNVDSIYFDNGATLTIEQAGQPWVEISKQDSASSVVWNPWQEKAKGLSNYNDDDYLRMVCVETANAEDDAVTIDPGSAHTMTMSIRSCR